MNVASWNVRGLNKGSHKKELKKFIASNNISFMGSLEMIVKIHYSSVISKRICRHWSWLNYYKFYHNGRIWVGWDSSIWDITLPSKSSQKITCRVNFLE